LVTEEVSSLEVSILKNYYILSNAYINQYNCVFLKLSGWKLNFNYTYINPRIPFLKRRRRRRNGEDQWAHS
jgi:hypothetical protein